MPKRNKEGTILFIVVAIIMVVSVLATAMLRTIANQSRLTHHQVSRIQAQYAAKAGMVYALDRLRLGTWTFAPSSCPNPLGCAVVDPSFPPSIQSVTVIFCPAGIICKGSTVACNPPAGLNFCINSVFDYTYTP